MKPRAVTGLGVASALGTSVDETFHALGVVPAPSATPPIASFDATKYGKPPVVEVPGFDPTKFLGDKGLRTLDRLTKLLIVAARLSLHHAGLKKDGQWAALAPERVTSRSSMGLRSTSPRSIMPRSDGYFQDGIPRVP